MEHNDTPQPEPLSPQDRIRACGQEMQDSLLRYGCQIRPLAIVKRVGEEADEVMVAAQWELAALALPPAEHHHPPAPAEPPTNDRQPEPEPTPEPAKAED
jgi:hypothetical protein